jgi:hypothetical protein
MTAPIPKVLPEHYRHIYDIFQASISRFDCGRKCAPLNGGSPVCCSTQNAVPVVHRAEYKELQRRTDLWFDFKPYDAATKKIVKDLHRSCTAVECKGVAFCERDNRSLACRAFPFFPYMNRAGEFIGLGTYWDFSDRCWMISNMQVVDAKFVAEFVAAYEYLFKVDPREYDTFKEFSATMRRRFSFKKQPIFLIKRDGSGYLKVLSHGRGMKEVTAAELRAYPPFTSEAAYARAAKAEGGAVPAEGLVPA